MLGTICTAVIGNDDFGFDVGFLYSGPSFAEAGGESICLVEFICRSVWGLGWNKGKDRFRVEFRAFKMEMFWQVKGFEATL
ncbi:MAG: hypothetical protein EBT26_02055 [Microbacteriaceae bacterium]|nr:hypothetical protein [Microbacteriaceae bacterium]